jgi:AraC family transcriptional regulator
MSRINVNIVQLDPMRVASFHAFGSSPEDAAWAKLEAWAKPRGLLDFTQHRVFGFNNPSPSAASPNYGYEFILTIGPEIQPDGEASLQEFPGGLYGVARIETINDPGVDIPEAWKKLSLWLEDSPYQMGRHQWLEEHIEAEGAGPLGWTLDLYIPLAGKSR